MKNDYTKLNQKLNFFMYKKKEVVWFYKLNANIIMYINENLKYDEQTDYMQRISNEKANYTMEGYQENSWKFGLLALHTNVEGLTEEEIYVRYKSRDEIEKAFDTYNGSSNGKNRKVP